MQKYLTFYFCFYCTPHFMYTFLKLLCALLSHCGWNCLLWMFYVTSSMIGSGITGKKCCIFHIDLWVIFQLTLRILCRYSTNWLILAMLRIWRTTASVHHLLARCSIWFVLNVCISINLNLSVSPHRQCVLADWLIPGIVSKLFLFMLLFCC